MLSYLCIIRTTRIQFLSVRSQWLTFCSLPFLEASHVEPANESLADDAAIETHPRKNVAIRSGVAWLVGSTTSYWEKNIESGIIELKKHWNPGCFLSYSHICIIELDVNSKTTIISGKQLIKSFIKYQFNKAKFYIEHESRNINYSHTWL